MDNSSRQIETNRLNEVASDSWYLKGVAPKTIEYSGTIFARHFRGGSVLELGPAEGTMTQHIYALAQSLTLVEGAESFCKLLRSRFPKADVIHALFEDYEPEQKFDAIILGHVLEHVIDPAKILEQVKRWLKPRTGWLFAAVPNARSLHRQAAVLMGYLEQEDALNDTDRHHGHRRVFNPESFRNAFYRAGFTIDVFGGYWLKPISNRQIEESWTPQMLDAFMQLGERYPDIAAEIYVVASVPEA